MPDKSAIEWTDATWNPIRGCSRVSEGCRHCYAEPIAARFSGAGQPYESLGKFVTPAGTDRREARWTGEVALAEHLVDQPLRWRQPRRIFVNSMSDLFHEKVPDEWIDRIFAVMALCPQHTFQILTKRPDRMLKLLNDQATQRRIYELACDMVLEMQLPMILVAPGIDETLAPAGQRIFLDEWPLKNVWIGVSVEDQVTAETRIPYLLQTRATTRFLSCEPLLGPINLRHLLIAEPSRVEGFPVCDALTGWHTGDTNSLTFHMPEGKDPRAGDIDWVIVGGESGRGARPMHPDWARSLRDQCAAAAVPFFFKQWGEWKDGSDFRSDAKAVLTDGRVLDFERETMDAADREEPVMRHRPTLMRKVGKAHSGRHLDGRTHDAFPETHHG